MAENVMDLKAGQASERVQNTAQRKLETAYSKILYKILDGEYEGSNERLVDDSGVREIFGNKGTDLMSVKLATGDDYASDRYKEEFKDSWDGVSPILVVESGYLDGNIVFVPAQELFDFVHDKKHDEKLSITSDDGETTARHGINLMDGISDTYRTTVTTQDGNTVEICTDLVYTLQGYQWETMAFTNDKDGTRRSIEDICCDLCDRSEDPTVMHETAVKKMKAYSGDLL